jgi:transposase
MERLPIDLPVYGHAWSRGEVLHGPERRRRWTFEQKSRIVAESFAPGAVTSSVALRHGVHRNQLYTWRRELREAASESRGLDVAFAPVVVESVGSAMASRALSGLEVEIAGAVVRVTRDSDLGLLTAVARALKAAS